MAVTLTPVQLAQQLRIIAGSASTIPDPAQAAIIGQVLGAATAMVEEFAPGAPEMVQNEATARAAGYLFDSPSANARRFSSVLEFSGAASILSQWRRDIRALPLGGG